METAINKSQLEEIVSLLNQCTDAYVFIYDLTEDSCSISDVSLKLFNLPSSHFFNATSAILNVVYSEDRPLLLEDINAIKAGKKEIHNLEYRWVNKENNPVWLNSRGKLITGSNGNKILVGRIAFIDKGLKIDSLTGLYTGAQLRDDYQSVAKRSSKLSGFLFKIDIDNLGTINEQRGRTGGDRVISLVSDCCRRSVGDTTRLYRSGSDEIMYMNFSGGNAEDVQNLYRTLKRTLAETEQKLDYEVLFTVSASAVAFFGSVPVLEDLLKKLEFAMSQAKRRGKNTLALFDAVAYSQRLHRLDLQEKLRVAVKNNFNGFELYYQPVIDAHSVYEKKDSYSDGDVIGAEALLRWSCPEFGSLMPDEFIPILEECGLIIPVGRWVLTTAFEQCHKWNKVKKNFRISVNLSYIQVKRNDILTDVQLALDTSGVSSENIVLELTESGSIESDTALQELLDELAKMHIKIDIDDFGSGYSNLRYLQEIHANTLKFDYSFVHKATTGDGTELKVIKYVSDMAHDLGMIVCMEGIETEEDIAKLKDCRPDTFQGFLFGRPVSAIQFEEQDLLKPHM
jgi:diguanylate cyclase (GGDEF)-like protein